MKSECIIILCVLYRMAGKFGGLAVCVKTAKLKSAKILLRVHVRMAIPYHTAKFKSTNGVKNVIFGQIAKFNDRQYFQLYGTLLLETSALP